MNIEAAVLSIAKVANVGGQHYLVFSYTSSVGKVTEPSSVQVPINHEAPSAGDRKALLEAVTVQGGIGKWVQKEDGSAWLVAHD